MPISAEVAEEEHMPFPPLAFTLPENTETETEKWRGTSEEKNDEGSAGFGIHDSRWAPDWN